MRESSQNKNETDELTALNEVLVNLTHREKVEPTTAMSLRALQAQCMIPIQYKQFPHESVLRTRMTLCLRKQAYFTHHSVSSSVHASDRLNLPSNETETHGRVDGGDNRPADRALIPSLPGNNTSTCRNPGEVLILRKLCLESSSFQARANSINSFARISCL